MTENKNDWVRRNVTDDFRIPDIVEYYVSMGFEVKVEDYVAEKSEPECSSCLMESPDKFKVIYTRRADNYEDELYRID